VVLDLLITIMSTTTLSAFLFSSIFYQATNQVCTDEQDYKDSTEYSYHRPREIAPLSDEGCVDSFRITSLLKEGFNVIQAVGEHILPCGRISLVNTGFDANIVNLCQLQVVKSSLTQLVAQLISRSSFTLSL